MDVNVLDYGAVGNDIHDDTLAFRAALNAIRTTGGTCTMPAGVYKVDPAGIMGSNNTPALTSDMHLVGVLDNHGTQLSSIHVHNACSKTIVSAVGSNWSIEKVRFIMSGFYPTDGMGGWVPGAGPITVLNQAISTKWLIDKCDFYGNEHFFIVARGDHWTISNNNIYCTYDPGHGAHPIHEGFIITATGGVYPSYGTIINNYLDGVGINHQGHHQIVRGNTNIRGGYGGFFQKGALNPAFNHSNQFLFNTGSYSNEGINDDGEGGHYGQIGGAELWSPYTLVLGNNFHHCSGFGLSVGGHHSVVAFNRCISNGFDSSGGDPRHGHRNGLLARTLLTEGNHSSNAHNSIFLGNVCRDPETVKTQDYGISVQADWIRCVAFVGNNLHGNGVGDGLYKNCQPNVDPLVGRDLLNNICDEKQRQMLLDLLDPDKFSIQDGWYVMLNQILFGSSNPRP